jgi:hypothetical protein
MSHRLRTDEGRALYKRRSATVEPAIGNLKKMPDRFSRRLDAALGELQLAATAFNLLKILRQSTPDIHATRRRRRAPRPSRDAGKSATGSTSGETQDHLYDECEAERPLPARGPRPRSLPQRAGRTEMPVSGHPIPGPDRRRRGTMVIRWKGRTERLRHNVRGSPDPEQHQRTAGCLHRFPDTPTTDGRRAGGRDRVAAGSDGTSARVRSALAGGTRLKCEAGTDDIESDRTEPNREQ